MKILALEFSSPQRGVAVYAPGTSMAQPTEAVESGRTASEPFRLTQEALAQAGIRREDIDCVAVGLGPGSYNGIRVAIAIAQGWQLARSVKLVGIESSRLIAAEAAAQGLQGPICVVIDAQRQEFYLAGYDIVEGNPQPTSPIRLATRAEADAACAGNVLPVGPDVTRWFPQGRIVLPRAAVLARLAATETRFVSGEDLTPVYLRETTFVKAPPPRMIP